MSPYSTEHASLITAGPQNKNHPTMQVNEFTSNLTATEKKTRLKRSNIQHTRTTIPTPPDPNILPSESESSSHKVLSLYRGSAERIILYTVITYTQKGCANAN
jgi:hypothetical protein